MTRMLAAILLSSTALAIQPPAQVLAGDWTITGEVEGVPISEACTFSQADAAITGSCKAQGKTWDTAGTADGKKVSFHHGAEYEGQALVLTFSGVLGDDGAVKGSLDVDPMNVSGYFTATKATVKSSPTPAPTPTPPSL